MRLRRGGNQQGFTRASVRPGTGSVLRVHGVEGWRALACVVVVIYHVWQNMDVAGNGVGPWSDRPDILTLFLNTDMVVDLFFALSGLLLFLPFAHACLDDTARVPNRRTFLWRRVLRLYPLYLVVVCLSWFPRNYGAGTAQWRDLLEHVFLVQAFDSERIFYTVGPAWSLSVEWIFYLALAALGPTLVHFVRELPEREARVRRLLAVLGAIIVASLLYKANVELVWHIPVTSWAWRFGPAAKADDIAIGMVLATVMVLLQGRTLPTWSFPVMLGASLGGLWLMHLPGGESASPYLLVVRHPGVALSWSVLLLAFMACRSPWPARVIDNPVLVRLGVWTMAIYLVHEPVLLGVQNAGWFSLDAEHFWRNVAVVGALTVVAAVLAHRLVEEPWIDAAALQLRSGGRAEIYPHLLLPVIVRDPGHSSGRLRERVLASVARLPAPAPVATRTAAPGGSA